MECSITANWWICDKREKGKDAPVNNESKGWRAGRSYRQE